MEPKIIMEIDKCPACGCAERLVQKAYDESGETAPEGAIPCMHVQILPLSNTVISSKIKALVSCVDTCVKCGRSYTFHAEVKYLDVPRVQPNPIARFGHG